MPIAGDSEASIPYLIEAVNRAMTSERRRARTRRAPPLQRRVPPPPGRQHCRCRRLGRFADLPAAHVRGMYNLVKNDNFSLTSPPPASKARGRSVCGTRSGPTIITTVVRVRRRRLRNARPPSVRHSPVAATKASLRDQLPRRRRLDGEPGRFFWTAAHHKIPLLTIVHNNRAWHQETMHVQGHGCDRRERQPEMGRLGKRRCCVSSPFRSVPMLAEPSHFGMAVAARC